MRKRLLLVAISALIALPSFGAYIVVLKNGTQYKAKSKWTMVGNKARIVLENGQSLLLDPALIDQAKSEATTKLNLGNAKIIDLSPNMPEVQEANTPKPSIGSQIKLRKPGTTPAPYEESSTPKATLPVTPVGTPPPAASGGNLPRDVTEKFARAYENVGLFEQKITSPSPGVLRAELTADREDKVFNALSATSFLMVRNAGVEGVRIDVVDLFMKTTTGGSAGRFQMTRADAEMIDKKQITLTDYFVRKVIF